MRPNDRMSRAPQPSVALSFEVPRGACDCHTHIHGDPETFPFFAGRVYTPEMALPDEMAALHKALRVQRVVIVTPSVYGTDNSATLYGMKARGDDARGVAVIDDAVTESQLDAMGEAGMRGIRLNLATSGMNDPRVARDRLRAAADRMARRNWHVQIYTTLPMISAIGIWSPHRPCRSCSTTSGAPRRAWASSSPASPTCWISSDRGEPTSRSPGPIAPRAWRRITSTWCRWPGLSSRRILTEWSGARTGRIPIRPRRRGASPPTSAR